jgi:hypothetical protein
MVAFVVQSDAGLKIFYVLVAIGRALAMSVCGLRFSAARRSTIACPGYDPHAIVFGDFPRWMFCPVCAAGHVGCLRLFFV